MVDIENLTIDIGIVKIHLPDAISDTTVSKYFNKDFVLLL